MENVFHPRGAPRTRTSDVLRELADQCDGGEVSLGSLTSRLGDRTFGILLIVVAALAIVPVISMIAGLLIAGLGLQMAIGRTRPYLPERVLNYQLPTEGTRKALGEFAERAERLEKFIRPRWHFSEAPIVDNLNGVVITLLGLIISIPLPFTNFAPSFIVVLMALGLLERDGVIQLAAFALGGGACTLVVILLQ